MSMAKRSIVLLMLFLAIVPVNSFSQRDVVLDEKYFQSLQNSDAITRLQMLNALKNNIIKSTASVMQVELTGSMKRDIVKKTYKIVLAQNLPRLTIIFNCYTNQDDYFDLLQAGDAFEFTGQCIAATPLNTRFNRFVIDIILEDGAIVIR